MQAPEIINSHIPRTCLDSLQGAQINPDLLGQPLLGEFRTQPQAENVASDEDMRFKRGCHPQLDALEPGF